ncbi:MAG: alpha/beta hydrolase [bacterium]|nr:alpha/beta hydrolase [bacterium]
MPPQSAAGTWRGTLAVAGSELRLVVKIRMGERGYAATMDSLDQGALNLPIDTLEFDGETLRFTMQALRADFVGVASQDDQSISGVFTQHGTPLPLVLSRTDEAIALTRPQEPKPPFPYRTIEVAYANKAAQGVRLAGVLTVPHGEGPFAAALLISGSGPQDRNGSVFGHKPFWVIADHLARNAIAVLRVDDRGTGESKGDLLAATSEDFALDVSAGVDFLKTRPEIARNRVGLIGHSEGGIIAPLVATSRDDIAFVVLLVSPGITGERTVELQIESALRHAGSSKAVIDRVLEIQRQLVSILAQDANPTTARARFRKLYENWSPADRALAGFNDDNIETKLDSLLLPWTRYFMTHDPAAILRLVDRPVLALFGEKDMQVPPEPNARVVKEALSNAADPDVTVEVLSGLNHLLQACETGMPGEYASIEQTIAPVVLGRLSDWIGERAVEREGD